MRQVMTVIMTTLIFQFMLVSMAEAQRRGNSAGFAGANRGTVGIVTGDADSTSLSTTSDLARVLDNGNKMRIIPVVGQGAQKNVADILYLKGIDLSIVPSDVLSYFKRTRRFPGLNKKLQYVTKLYNEEFHVLANMNYLCLDDLSGRRVNFGKQGSGTAMTAEAVFNAHGVRVERSFHDQKTATEMLKRGELDALVYVSGKPSRGFENITFKNRVHFLDVTYVDKLQDDYLPASLTNKDYPDLVAPGEKVETVAVGAVLAVYNWKKNGPRYRKVANFIDAFFSNFKTFQSFPHHPKWKEVNLNSVVPGWQRFAAADVWLARNKRQTKRVARATQSRASGRASQQAFQTFLRNFGGDLNKLSDNQKNELFAQFMRWQNQQRRR